MERGERRPAKIEKGGKLGWGRAKEETAAALHSPRSLRMSNWFHFG